MLQLRDLWDDWRNTSQTIVQIYILQTYIRCRIYFIICYKLNESKCGHFNRLSIMRKIHKGYWQKHSSKELELLYMQYILLVFRSCSLDIAVLSEHQSAQLDTLIDLDWLFAPEPEWLFLPELGQDQNWYVYQIWDWMILAYGWGLTV